MVFLLSGPSRGCDAIRSSSSEGLRWLLMERTRMDESHRHWPFPRGLRWAVQFTPEPCSGWLGSEEQPVHWRPLRSSSPLTLHIGCLHKSRCYKYTCLLEVAGEEDLEDDEDGINKRNDEAHLFCICHPRKCKTGGSV